MGDRAARAALLAAALPAAVLFALAGHTSADEGTLVHDGLRVLRGEAPYRDFFQFIPPGTAWLAAAMQGAVGPGVLGPRLAQEALLVAGAGALWGLARRLGVGPWLALAPALAPLLALHRFLPTYNHHWLALATGAIALGLGARALAEGAATTEARAASGAGPWAWAGAGAAGAATLLCLQSDGLVVLLALAGALALDALVGGRPWRAAARALVAGALAVQGAAALVLAATRALGAMLHDVWVWPFARYRTPGGVNDIAFATDLHANLSPFVGFVNLPAFYAKALHVGLLYAFLVGAAVGGAAWLVGLARRRAREGPGWEAQEAAGALVALASIGLLAVATRGRADVMHVAAYAWPAGLLAAAAAAALARTLPGGALALVRQLPAGLVAAWVATGGLLLALDVRQAPATWLAGRPPDAALAAAPAVAWLRGHARPGDRLVAWPFAGYFGLYGGMPVAGRWNVMLPPEDGYTSQAEYAAFWEGLMRDRPRFVVWAPVAEDREAVRRFYFRAPLAGYRLVMVADHPLYGPPRAAEIYERVAP